MSVVALIRFRRSREVRDHEEMRTNPQGSRLSSRMRGIPWLREGRGDLGMMLPLGPSAQGMLGLGVDSRVETTDP